MINVLFAARSYAWAEYEAPLTEALNAALGGAGHEFRLARDFPPEEVDYIVYAPNSTLTDFGPYQRCKAVLNLWAGVEDIAPNTTLTQPLARMVDPGLTEGMVEWVTGHILRHHLGMDSHIVNPDGAWDDTPPPLARNRNVTILGLGALGAASAKALAALNFNVTGWSRAPKDIAGVTCLSGPDALEQALSQAWAVVLLLPLTPMTENTLDGVRLAQLPKGAVILNPGRGALIEDEALLAALDSGQVSHATLDTFRTEPLPGDHPYWSDPHVTVTPHIASSTRADTSSQVIAKNILRGETGKPFLYLVDRARGY